jgi:hypothetical protein
MAGGLLIFRGLAAVLCGSRGFSGSPPRYAATSKDPAGGGAEGRSGGVDAGGISRDVKHDRPGRASGRLLPRRSRPFRYFIKLQTALP